jgi:hypothetical protein
MPIVQYYPRRIAKGCLIREMACTDTVENDVLRGALNRHRDYSGDRLREIKRCWSLAGLHAFRPIIGAYAHGL